MKPPFALLLLIMLMAGMIPGAVRAAPNPTTHLAQSSPEQLGVQGFLDQQPGPLKTYRDGDRSAATIIESNSLYYGLSPRLTLALLETSANLLSSASPPDAALRQPFGTAGPDGFAAQLEWANRELRAGLGPYDRPPTLRFTDGTTITLSLQQAPEGVAVQRFLALNRTQAEWRTLVDRFGQAFQRYFNNELPELGGSVQPPARQVQPSSFSLMQPWPPGARVVHLAYFDHVYPTVDSGRDSNNIVVTYTGQRNVQYDGHDGHDYYFPDQPIGSPILAAAAGTAYARTHRGNGVVIVHPDGYETVYWHLDGFSDIFRDKVDTSQGVRVEAGTFLGTSGKTGFTDGTPHLHFEVRRYGRQVDPYGWYGFAGGHLQLHPAGWQHCARGDQPPAGSRQHAAHSDSRC